MKNSKSKCFTTLNAVAFCIAVTLGMEWNLTAADAEPNPPQLLSYQGYLSDKDGVPIGNSDPVNYDVVFRIYDAEETSADEKLLWSEQQTVTFDAGNFSVLLGAGKQYNSESYGNLSDVFDNVHASEVSERYIGITVQGLDSSGTDSELVPRLRLLTSPYAFLATKALVADKLTTDDFSVDAESGLVTIDKNLTVSGTATFEKDIKVTGIASSGDAVIAGELEATTLHSTGNTTVDGQLTGVDMVASGKLEVDGGIVSNGRLHVLSTQDGDGDDSRGSVFIGDEVSYNLAIDPNEIHARLWDATTSTMGPSMLYLNANGGNIRLGSSSTEVYVPGLIRVDGGVLENFTLEAYMDVNGSANRSEERSDLKHGIIVKQRVRAASYDVESDGRIKKIIGRTNGASSLMKMRQLEVMDYQLVDKIAQGQAMHRGVIAQEVEKLIPEAITRSSGFIPDIYAPALNCFFDQGTRILTVSMEQPHGLNPGDVVRLIMPSSQEEFTVLETPTARSFSVHSDTDTARLFVYGRKVDDFRSVDYDMIFSTGISALQELDQQVQALKKSQARITELEAQVARVDSLEQELKAMKQLLTQLVKKQDESKLTAQVVKPLGGN